MKIENLEQLLQEELRDLYDAEKQLVKALPKMAKAASSPDLQNAFNEHLEQTKGHVDRLEQAFEALGMKASGKTCAAMKGIVEEGKEAIEQDAVNEVHDAALIGAAQRVEHYEIAAYGTARTLAEKVGYDDVVDLLQQTLEEEKETDQKLTELSEEILESMAPEMVQANEMEETQGSSRSKSGGAKVRRSSGS